MCLPSGHGELNQLARTVVSDLARHTSYDYTVDEDGNEDSGNEVSVGWGEGMLEVSVDAAFATSRFCVEYPKKSLQQDPERMEGKKSGAFDTLIEQNPHLDEVYFYALRDTMRELEKKKREYDLLRLLRRVRER